MPFDGEPETVAPHDPFEYFERLRRVRTYVEEHLHGDLSLKVVAGISALAPSSFRRYFRKHVGRSFGRWLADYRIDRACGLLREGDLQVSRVGSAVGFRSGRSFRRAFRRQIGHSPSEYRKRYLEEVTRTGSLAAIQDLSASDGVAERRPVG